jgi:hypothetical protein
VGNGQTLTVTFTPSDTTDYNTAIATVPINVLKPRPVTVQLVRVGKKKRLMVEVLFPDTGALKEEFRSPFQKPAFRNIRAALRDSNFDGTPDEVVVTARKGKRPVTVTFPV